VEFAARIQRGLTGEFSPMTRWRRSHANKDKNFCFCLVFFGLFGLALALAGIEVKAFE
jgi:hypothetical protein